MTEEMKNLENNGAEENNVGGSGATNTDDNKEVNPTPDNQNQGNEPNDNNGAKSQDEIIAQLRLDNAKLKRATDKATAEASEYKKKLRDKQSAEEIEAQEKAEKEAQREEEYNALKRENEINKLEKTFLGMGSYSEEQAHKSAVAQYDGDMETVFAIQKEVQEQIKNDVKAEIIANNPEINSGEGEEKETDPFLDGFNSVE